MIRFAMIVAFVSAACGGDDGGKTIDASTIDAPAFCGTAAMTPFLGQCTMDSMCGDCVCHSFGHTMACTKTCTDNAQCPAPSGGCTAGFCRP